MDGFIDMAQHPAQDHPQDRALLALAEARVPRYTSYPTAPHFGPQVDGAVYAQWLAALPADARASLYLHVPFCAELCLYCGCTTSVARRPAPVSAYAERLRQERVRVPGPRKAVLVLDTLVRGER